jgi:antitoxin ParD1/3/4
MSGRTLQVTLSEEIGDEIETAVARGEYASESEAVSSVVADWYYGRRAFGPVGELTSEELRRLWQEGVASGPGRGLTLEEIKLESRARLAQERNNRAGSSDRTS